MADEAHGKSRPKKPLTSCCLACVGSEAVHVQNLGKDRQKMFENTPDLIELFRNFPISISVLFVLPIVFFSSQANGAHEFPAFRMQQFDLHQSAVGEFVYDCVLCSWLLTQQNEPERTQFVARGITVIFMRGLCFHSSRESSCNRSRSKAEEQVFVFRESYRSDI